MARILWADDEIDSLKPHILFLENKGHQVDPVQSGVEAVENVTKINYDVIFLDENMPGMNGLEALEEIKSRKPNTPVVMITKSEEEFIMEEAIGKQISDYLIKPVNPNQILIAVKKLMDGKRLVSESTSSSYRQKFRELSDELNQKLDVEGWKNLFQKLNFWELQLEKSDQNMSEVLQMQKNEANQLFSKFVDNEYYRNKY